MKELNELVLPDDVLYSDDHEWVRREGDMVRVGISDFAQDQLGDIVFVELPSVGAAIAKNQSFGVIESVKSVSDMLMPVGGEVTEVNNALEGNPELVNTGTYGGGWMLVVKPDDPTEIEALMTAETYMELLKGSG